MTPLKLQAYYYGCQIKFLGESLVTYAYVGIVVPSRQPVRQWCLDTLSDCLSANNGFDSYELGGWFVRADMLDEQISGAVALERLDARAASLRRDPLLRLYALIGITRIITYRARLEGKTWRILRSNRNWASHIRAQLQPTMQLAFAIVHVTPLAQESTRVLADHSNR